MAKFLNFARIYGFFVHGLLLIYGLVALLAGTIMAVGAQGDGAWATLRTGAGIAFASFAAPFLPLSRPRPWLHNLAALGCGNLLVGCFVIVSASLGLATLRRRRGGAVCYALFAAAILARFLDKGLLFRALSKMEDIGPNISNLTELQYMKRHTFTQIHDRFVQMYKEHECKVTIEEEYFTKLSRFPVIPLIVSCNASTLEGKFLQELVNCSRVGDLRQRAGICRDRGLQLGLLSEAAIHDAVFCNCWPARFDELAFEAWLFFGNWLIGMLGVAVVLYTAAEQRLASMCAQEKWDVICFMAVGVAILACKAAFFTQMFPAA